MTEQLLKQALALRHAAMHPITAHYPPSGGGSFDYCIHQIFVKSFCAKCVFLNAERLQKFIDDRAAERLKNS